MNVKEIYLFSYPKNKQSFLWCRILDAQYNTTETSSSGDLEIKVFNKNCVDFSNVFQITECEWPATRSIIGICYEANHTK